MDVAAYTIALAGVGLLCVGMWIVGWLRRDSAVSVPYLAFTSALVLWVIAYIWEIEAESASSMVLAAKMQYLGIPVIPVAALWFSILHSGRARWFRPSFVMASALVPLLTVVMAWTNESHGLLWQSYPVSQGSNWSVLDVTYGPYFWIHVAYSYLSLLAALIVFGEVSLRASMIWRRQTLLVSIGLVSPWLANLLYVTDLAPFAPFDITPLAFGVSAVAFGFGSLNVALLTLAPVARDLILDTVGEGVLVVDPAGRVVDVNRAAGRILELDPATALGRDGVEVLGPFSPVLSEPESRAGGIEIEVRGETYDCAAQPVASRGGEPIGTALIFHDITQLTAARRVAEEAKKDLERRVEERTEALVDSNRRLTEEMSQRIQAQEQEQATQAQLLQAQKLDTVGRLAGGIAHDFNNLLMAILGFNELALNQTEPDTRIRHYLGQVTTAADRARELVSQILTFSRQEAPTERQSIELQAVVPEVVRLMRAVIPASVHIETRLDPRAPPVWVDPNKIHQVLMNVCSNAAQAMPDGGRVDLVLAESPAPSVRTEASLNAGIAAERWLSLTVGDTGMGMNHETLDRAFEPFFTTKDPGEGTGLGLSVVHGIMTSHGGEVTVRSEPEVGTRFTLWFPVPDNGAHDSTTEKGSSASRTGATAPKP